MSEIEEIIFAAFVGSSYLESVHIGKNVKTIKENPFFKKVFTISFYLNNLVILL